MEEDFTKLYTAERGMNVPFPRHGLHGIAPDMKRAFDVLRLNQDELDQTEVGVPPCWVNGVSLLGVRRT
jgi:hypothetical protein